MVARESVIMDHTLYGIVSRVNIFFKIFSIYDRGGWVRACPPRLADLDKQIEEAKKTKQAALDEAKKKPEAKKAGKA